MAKESPARENPWHRQLRKMAVCWSIVWHITSGHRKKGDVVAFTPKGNTSANDNVKRIVAVPGDTVQIKSGRLYVNGTATNLKQTGLSIKDAGRAETEITLGDDEYFVLGDNVNNSEDSRYESIGNVTCKEMIGKVWFCLSLKGFGPVN